MTKPTYEELAIELEKEKAKVADFDWAWQMSPSIKQGFTTMGYDDGEISCQVACRITDTSIERIQILREAVKRKQEQL
jgi:hypothetical protein